MFSLVHACYLHLFNEFKAAFFLWGLTRFPFYVSKLDSENIFVLKSVHEYLDIGLIHMIKNAGFLQLVARCNPISDTDDTLNQEQSGLRGHCGQWQIQGERQRDHGPHQSLK